MEISSSENSVTIFGNIKSISDFQEIKNILDSITKIHKNILINIPESLSITSSVIGYFNKLVLKDNIDLHMKISNQKLIELISDLNLASVFKIQKV